MELKERFQNYQNVLTLYKFFKSTIRWLCENFHNQKLVVIICEYDENIEILNNKQMDKIVKYHKLLVKFNDMIKNNFLMEEQKSDAILNFMKLTKRLFCKNDINN